MTREQFDERLRYWQQKLRLQDWEIELHLVSWREIGERAGAQVRWLELHKYALVQICREDDWKPEDFGPDHDYDGERLLVHELLHLVLSDLPFDHDRTVDAEELAINILTDALLALDRRSVGPWPS